MEAAEIIDKIVAAGGRIWLEDGKVQAIMPTSMRSLEDLIRSLKPQIIAELARRLEMPAGVRLIRWEPKDPPIRLSDCATVTNTEKFIFTTLRQLDAQLQGKTWLAGNWGLSGLIARLEAVGCFVALEDPRLALQ
jgi:hypothetical protein